MMFFHILLATALLLGPAKAALLTATADASAKTNTAIPAAATISVQPPSLVFAGVKQALAQKGFSQKQIAATFRRFKLYKQSTVHPKPPTDQQWLNYKNNLIEQHSVARGIKFMVEHKADLDNAEAIYHVKAEDITAVFRGESDFGSNTGIYIVPDVYYSYVQHGINQQFWSQNLVAILVFAKDHKIDPFGIKGSYAGALGPMQFLAVNILNYGVDGNGDGKIDPNNYHDAIPSVANMLSHIGYDPADPRVAFGHYYGSSVGYPDALYAYSQELQMPPNAKDPSL